MHNAVEMVGKVQQNAVVDQHAISRIVIIRNVFLQMEDLVRQLGQERHRHRVLIEKMVQQLGIGIAVKLVVGGQAKHRSQIQ